VHVLLLTYSTTEAARHYSNLLQDRRPQWKSHGCKIVRHLANWATFWSISRNVDTRALFQLTSCCRLSTLGDTILATFRICWLLEVKESANAVVEHQWCTDYAVSQTFKTNFSIPGKCIYNLCVDFSLCRRSFRMICIPVICTIPHCCCHLVQNLPQFGVNLSTLCLKKRAPFLFFCDYSVCCWPILKVSGSIV